MKIAFPDRKKKKKKKGFLTEKTFLASNKFLSLYLVQLKAKHPLQDEKELQTILLACFGPPCSSAGPGCSKPD